LLDSDDEVPVASAKFMDSSSGKTGDNIAAAEVMARHRDWILNISSLGIAAYNCRIYDHEGGGREGKDACEGFLVGPKSQEAPIFSKSHSRDACSLFVVIAV